MSGNTPPPNTGLKKSDSLKHTHQHALVSEIRLPWDKQIISYENYVAYVNTLTRTKPAISAQDFSSGFRMTVVALHEIAALNHQFTSFVGTERISTDEVYYLNRKIEHSDYFFR